MFEIIAALVMIGLVTNQLGVITDQDVVATVNTVLNFATVCLLVWHQRRVVSHIEPVVQDTAAVVKRQLGERQPLDPELFDDRREYNGPERRKEH